MRSAECGELSRSLPQTHPLHRLAARAVTQPYTRARIGALLSGYQRVGIDGACGGERLQAALEDCGAGADGLCGRWQAAGEEMRGGITVERRGERGDEEGEEKQPRQRAG